MPRQRILDIDAEMTYMERCFGITHRHVTGGVRCIHPTNHHGGDLFYEETLRSDTAAVQRDISRFLESLPEVQRTCRNSVYRLLLYRCKLEKQKRRKRETASVHAYEKVSRKISTNAASISSRMYDLLGTILHPLLQRIGITPHPYLLLSGDLLELQLLEAGTVLRRAVKKAFIAEETYGALENILHEST